MGLGRLCERRPLCSDLWIPRCKQRALPRDVLRRRLRRLGKSEANRKRKLPRVFRPSLPGDHGNWGEGEIETGKRRPESGDRKAESGKRRAESGVAERRS